MKNIETGGPAFPNSKFNNVFGMTLRDYFAAKASEEDIADYRIGPTTEHVIESLNGLKSIVNFPEMRTRMQAKYLYADAMLEARK